MRDRQYFSSLAISIAVAVATVAAISFFVAWLSWRGTVGLLIVLGVLLAWFYWGPRAESTPRRGRDGIKGARSE